jgi:hypothetical protein
MEENNTLDLFRRFEPKIYGKEDYHIFNSFYPYKEAEVDTIF